MWPAVGSAVQHHRALIAHGAGGHRMAAAAEPAVEGGARHVTQHGNTPPAATTPTAKGGGVSGGGGSSSSSSGGGSSSNSSSSGGGFSVRSARVSEPLAVATGADQAGARGQMRYRVRTTDSPLCPVRRAHGRAHVVGPGVKTRAIDTESHFIPWRFETTSPEQHEDAQRDGHCGVHDDR